MKSILQYGKLSLGVLLCSDTNQNITLTFFLFTYKEFKFNAILLKFIDLIRLFL